MPSNSSGFLPSRRRFVKLIAAACGGVVFGGGLTRQWRLLNHPKARTLVLKAESYDTDLSEELRRAIAAFPEFEKRCRGAKVLLKPNFVEYHDTRPINTDPSVVTAAVEAFRKLGAREVVVGEGPGNQRDIESILEYSGLGTALRDVGAPFVDLNLDDIAPVPLASNHTKLGRLFLPATVLNADIVVSMPKLKTHKWTGVTLSMKNLFGVVPGAKYGWPKNILHWRGIDESIWDTNLAVKPAFAIVDGIVGMQGEGPLHGTGVNTGVLVLGDNLTAVDATAARIMGVVPERIGHIAGMAKHGGALLAERIQQLGEAIASVRQDYTVPAHITGISDPLPLIHRLLTVG